MEPLCLILRSTTVGIVHFGQVLWKGPRRAAIPLARAPALTQAAMRSLVVVLAAKAVKGALLGTEVGLGRIGRGRFKGAVHALMAAILLRLPQVDTLGQDAQLQPPNRQPAQAAHRHARKRCAVVGANGTRQTILTERPVK